MGKPRSGLFSRINFIMFSLPAQAVIRGSALHRHLDDPVPPVLEQVVGFGDAAQGVGVGDQRGGVEAARRDQGPVTPGGRVPQLFEKYPNLYGDLSANSAGCAIMRDLDFGLAFLERYADRLFFATDMVNTEMVFPLGAWLDRQCEEGRLSRAAHQAVCRENARRVFGL